MLRGCLLDKSFVSDENVLVRIRFFLFFFSVFSWFCFFSFLLFPMLSLPEEVRSSVMP